MILRVKIDFFLCIPPSLTAAAAATYKVESVIRQSVWGGVFRLKWWNFMQISFSFFAARLKSRLEWRINYRFLPLLEKPAKFVPSSAVICQLRRKNVRCGKMGAHFFASQGQQKPSKQASRISQLLKMLLLEEKPFALIFGVDPSRSSKHANEAKQRENIYHYTVGKLERRNRCCGSESNQLCFCSMWEKSMDTFCEQRGRSMKPKLELPIMSEWA